MPEPAATPLAGVRVVDLTIWIQGPVAATILADLGADVIKLEKAGEGDFSRNARTAFGVEMRRPERANLLWSLFNRNKRDVALDLRHPRAADVLRRLVEGADVFVTNLMDDALAALGADEPTIRGINPRVVYARGLGLGEQGPRAADPCMDTVGLAYSGFMYTSSGDAQRPYYPPGALADVLSGTSLAFGILAALMRRNATGEGQTVSSSQLQSLMWLQTLNVGVSANLGRPFEPFDRRDAPVATFNTYQCADGRWLGLGVGAGQERQWCVLCQVMSLEHLLADERFTDLAGRMAHNRELTRLFDERFATAPADYWLGLLRSAGVWVSPVNRVQDLTDDPQVRANGYLFETTDGDVAPALPFSLAGHTVERRGAPSYGADSDTVLADLGFTADEVADLRAAGALW
ncbi:MAG: CoA transferase [Dehalococcoidia bacterium]|nr:CoA transferase [Dehalococcoidia bacterium]